MLEGSSRSRVNAAPLPGQPTGRSPNAFRGRPSPGWQVRRLEIVAQVVHDYFGIFALFEDFLTATVCDPAYVGAEDCELPAPPLRIDGSITSSLAIV